MPTVCPQGHGLGGSIRCGALEKMLCRAAGEHKQALQCLDER